MKKQVILSAAVAALVFVSCNREDDQIHTPRHGEKNARLELVLHGTHTRATASALPTNESNIKTIAVGVFNADGSVNVIAEPTVVQSGATLASINCTPGTVDVIVVANAARGKFSSITSKAAFIALTTPLSETQTANVQKSDNLPMSGEATGVVLTANATKTTSIAISRLVSRISISSIKTAFDPAGSYKNATFTLKKIFMYNAMSVSPVNPATSVVGTTPLNGGSAPGGVWANGTAWLLDTPTGTVANAAYSTPHWFYTFANNNTSMPTKLVISGDFDADGSGPGAAKTVYYPIVINKKQLGTTITGDAGSSTGEIKRNAEYKLVATIKGNGANDPATDISPAALSLTITVAPWALTINQDVTFE